MNRRLTTIAVAGAVGVGALTASVAVPALADTVTGGASASDAVGGRVSAIREALQGLVDDKTLTDAQADKVADTLGKSERLRGPGGPGHHRHGFFMAGPGGMEAVAKVLGIEVDDVMAALRDGKTLGELAKEHGKSSDDVVTALTTEAKARLAEAVKDGRLTQERADELSEGMEQRIRQFVEEGRPAKGNLPGRGMPGPGGPGHPFPGPDDDGRDGQESPTPAPPSTGSTTPSGFLTT